MNVTLSWDLFVIVFFAIVITYSFIIGKDSSVKIIIATYIAIVASQGLGNLIERFSGQSELLFSMIGVSLSISILASTKLILFVAAVVFLAVRGGFEIAYSKDGPSIVDAALIALFGFVTAGLFLSTLMTFVADRPLLDQDLATVPHIATIIQQSKLLHAIVVYQDLWFSLPALILLTIGVMMGNDNDND